MFAATAAAGFPFGLVAGFVTAQGGPVPAWVIPANALAVPVAACAVFVFLSRIQTVRAWRHAFAVAFLTWIVAFPINVGLMGMNVLHWAVSLVVIMIALAVGVPIGAFLRHGASNRSHDSGAQERRAG